MKTILVFSGSNSSTSINQRLVIYAAHCLEGVNLKIIHLKDYPAPLYSWDLEQAGEFPDTMMQLNDMFKGIDGMLISLPEYNSGITPVFKNAMDWISRIEKPTLKNKPVCLLATSPGARGGKSNLEHVANVLIERWGGRLTSTFSLASFGEHWQDETLAMPKDLSDALSETLSKFKEVLDHES